MLHACMQAFHEQCPRIGSSHVEGAAQHNLILYAAARLLQDDDIRWHATRNHKFVGIALDLEASLWKLCVESNPHIADLWFVCIIFV
jgi:hypothetical protein